MSVKMQLMKNSQDRKKINKNPSNIGKPISCILKENTSLFSPTMLVSKEALGGNWASANYAYIPDFGGRYYFIDNIEAMTGGMMAFHLTVDPLKTYAGDLMGTAFMIARSESDGSPYFIDAEKALQSDKVVDYQIIGHIDQDQTGNKFAITVAGGMS